MSSRNRNFRRRAEDDDANGEETTTALATVTAKKLSSKDTNFNKPRKQHQQGPKLLSFADEEDESPLSRPSSRPSSDRYKSSSRLSKSSSTHKITSTKERLPTSSPSLPSNVQPQAGEYTQEKLRELQKNTRTLASSKPPPSESKRPPEPVIVLKGLVKPISAVEDKRFIDDAKEDEDIEEERRNSDSLLDREKDDTENRLASMGLGKSHKTKDSSLIPDQATINAIRAKRERLRQSRAAAPDYISLDGGSNHGAAEGLSDEEPEFQGRIALLGDRVDDVKKGVFEIVEGRTNEPDLRKHGEFEVEDEEDEEDKIWEEEQFRKGLGISREESRMVNKVPVQTLQQQTVVYPGTAYQSVPGASVGAAIGGSVGVSRSVEVISISQQAEVATKALQESVRRLKESHGRTLSSMARTDENLSASLLNISALEKSLSDAGRMLEKKHAGRASEADTSGLARRLKKMLVELNEYDKARAISRTFQLKEAL